MTSLSATNLTDITYDLMSLDLPDGLTANVTVRAINSIGSSGYSDPVAFMIPSRKCWVNTIREDYFIKLD